MLYISAPSLYLTNLFLLIAFGILCIKNILLFLCTALSANKQTEYTSPHLLADKNCNTGGSSLHRPHRSCTVISLTGLRFPATRKYHYHRYASSPHVTATYFARSRSLLTFASMSCSNISSRFTLLKNRAGTSWRICLVALHILTSCMQYSIQFSRYTAVNLSAMEKGS